MNDAGHQLTVIVATGGLCHSKLFLQELADSCKLPVFLPQEQDSCLQGSAILAARACGAEMSVKGQHAAFMPRQSRGQFRELSRLWYARFLVCQIAATR
jgi:sugar (pentulose or hexulose) kinase